MLHTDFILYFNITVIAIIALGALIGFIRGAFKSIYSLIIFVGLLVLGWFLTPLIAKAIMNFDLSTIYPLQIDGVTITKLNESIPLIATAISPDLGNILVADSLAYELVYEIIFMVVRIVSFVIWLVLMATVIKIIVKIIQAIILRKKAKAKKSAASRFVGFFVGAVHGLVIVFIINVILSGIAAVTPILSISIPNEEEINVSVVIEDNFIELGNVAVDDNEMIEEVVKFFDGYRDTLGGKISGLLKIKQQPFDEYVFSSMLTFNFNNQKVHLMDDLRTGVKIYVKLQENITGQINLESILALDEAVLNEVFGYVAELDLIGVAIPVGVEYLYKQTEVISEDTYNQLITDILKVDFTAELNNLKSALIAANNMGLFGEHEDNNYLLTLDVNQVKILFTNLGKLELIELLGKTGLEFLLNSDKANDFFEKNNIDKDDLDFANVDIGNEISNLGEIYEAFRGLNLGYDEEGKLVFDNVTDIGINAFGAAVYDSQLLANNSKLLAKTMVSLMPEEFQTMLTVEDLKKADFVSLLSLANVLLKANIGDEENFDPKKLLTEANIEAISEYISSSELLSSNVGKLLETLLSQVGMPVTIEISEDIVWSGPEGKTELSSLFHSAKILLEKENLPEDLFTLTKTELNNILSSSVISQAIVKIIEQEAAEGGSLAGFLIIDRVVEWYDTIQDGARIDGELRKLFASSKILFGENPNFDDMGDLVKVNNIIALSDEEIDLLIDSIILKDSLANQLIKVGEEGILNINLPLFDASWDTEIKNFIIGTKVLFGESVDLNNLSLSVDTVVDLSPENMNKVVNSIILVDTAVNKITELTTTGGSMHGILIIPAGLQAEDYRGANGELKKFLVASKIIKGTGSIENVVFDVDKFLGPDQEELLASKIFEASAIEFIKKSDKLIVPLASEGDKYYYLADTTIVWERTYSGNTITDIGELRKFLAGVKEIIGTSSFADLAFTMDTMLAVNFDSVLHSRVLEATIAKMIADLITSGTLTGFVKEPASGYQWYYHKTSTDALNGVVRRGEYELTAQPTYQYSDLLGLIEAIQKMNAAGLNYSNIDYNTIAAGNTNDLADALWDYSRIMRGSIASLLNQSLSGVANPLKPVFTDDQFTTKADVLNALVTFKTFVALL